MKTILVPTDFSKLSKVAVSYAIGLAKKMDAKIILLCVTNATASTDSLTSMKKLEESMEKTARRDADQLMGEVSAEVGKVGISYRSVSGFPLENVINEFAETNKVDLIVMGTKGATGLKKVLIGSNATAVINNSSVPVIVVPDKARFKSIKTLVYATDVQNFLTEIKTVGKFANLFGASIQVLHVMPEGSPKMKDENDATMISREKLVRMARYPKIHLNVVRNNSIPRAVDGFVNDQKADLLAMFTHRLDFFEKLTGKSVTRQLAFHSSVPLLTFNKSKR